MNFRIFFIASLLICSTIAFGQQKFKVVATASMIADMAKNIGGDAIEVKTIVPIGGDPHIYEPTPSDAQLVASADLILKNGLTFEGWLNELIENSGTKASVATVTDGIEPIQSTKYQNATDPHAWMAANLGIIYSENIKNALSKLDPANQKMFEFNFGVYKQQLEETDQYIKEQLQKIPEQRRILITSHDAFQYYGRRYGIRLESVLGTSTDAEVQTSDMIRLNKVIRESGVPAVFIESTINPKLLQQLASDNKIGVGGKLFSDSIGDEKSAAPTYIAMLRHNTDVIVAALSGEVSQEKSAEPDGLNWKLYGGIMGAFLIAVLFFIFNRFNKQTGLT